MLGLNTSFFHFNFYMIPDHWMGFHSDDQHDLDTTMPIVSGSHGATRVFQVKEKDDSFLECKENKASRSKVAKKQPKKVFLEQVMTHGSCSIMYPGFHDKLLHGVPVPMAHHPPIKAVINGKETTIRVNYTARCLAADIGKDDSKLIPKDIASYFK